MLLPLVVPSLHQVLQQSAESWELLSYVADVDELQQLEVLVASEEFSLVQSGSMGRALQSKNGLHVVLDRFKIIVALLFLFSLLSELFVGLSDVLDELDDGFEVEVVDAVLDLIVMSEGIVVPQERLKELSYAVLDGPLLEDLVEDEFGNELDVAEDDLLLVLEEELLLLVRLELWELFDFLIEGVLHLLNKVVLEGVVLLLLALLALLLGLALELELVRVPLAEVAAEFGVGAGVLGLVPGLLDDLIDEHLADLPVVEEVLDDVLLDVLQVFGHDEVEVVDDLLLGLFNDVHGLVLLGLEGGKVLAGHVLDLVLHDTGLEGFVLADGDLHPNWCLRLVAVEFGSLSLILLGPSSLDDVVVLVIVGLLLVVVVPADRLVVLLLNFDLLGGP